MGSTGRNVFTAYSPKILPKIIPKVSVYEAQPVELVHFSVKTSDSVGSLGTLPYILRNVLLFSLTSKSESRYRTAQVNRHAVADGFRPTPVHTKTFTKKIFNAERKFNEIQ